MGKQCIIGEEFGLSDWFLLLLFDIFDCFVCVVESMTTQRDLNGYQLDFV